MRKLISIYAVAVCGTLYFPALLPAQQVAPCSAAGYRVVTQRWDVQLQKMWELRQDCSHPAWPARVIALNITHTNGAAASVIPRVPQQLVHAGDRVRLWMQDAHARIEMSGVAGQSAVAGEHIMVRILQQFQGDGFAVQLVPGIVRGPDDVEMER
jgi:hypothetical protein